MKVFQLFAACLGLAPAVLGAASWAGSNLYYAAGLTTDEQEKLFSNLQEAGVKVLRVWLDGQPDEQKGTQINGWSSLEGDSPGNWNDDVLNKLDDVMVKAADYGIKLHISLHSYNALKAHNDFYGAWYGTGDFYTNSDAISYFKNRISHVLSHVNPNSGKTWAESSEYIFGFEPQNEPDQENNNPSSSAQWQCTMAQTLKDAMNGRSDILTVSGGGGWLATSLNDVLFDCESLDVVAIHAYGAGDLTASALSSGVSTAQSAGKKLIMQEWGACYFDVDKNNECHNNNPVLSASQRDANLQNWADGISSAGIPQWYWQILPNEDPHSDWDYEVGIDGANWDTLKAVMQGTSDYEAAFDFSQWLL
ncbi:beta-1,3-mannanase [Xylariomycetidae sp. FL0641]|nr:beta-1,3-mannanase [Xylariomycetidae sp. FL0641]